MDIIDKRWLHLAVPAATLTTAYLIYSNRGWLVHSFYKLVAKARPDKPGEGFLKGNYGPVRDELFEDVKVEKGEIPSELEGAYVRTGPNPYFPPIHGYHWFDGDGMLHAVRIRKGNATYCNRYVETARLQQERRAGEPLFVKFGDIMGRRGVLLMLLDAIRRRLGFVSYKEGAGTANTALVYHAERLLALHEGDLPYVVRILCSGALQTMGRMKLSGAADWKHPFTAHPKIDGKTGEMLFLGYTFDRTPYVQLGLMDSFGLLQRKWEIDVPYPVMMHDMAATANYAVIMHLPLVFDGESMMRDDSMPIVYKKDRPALLGLLRRDAPSSAPGCPAPVTWFELPSFFSFHTANAWEDKAGRVKVYTCTFPEGLSLDLDMNGTSSKEEQLRRAPRLYEYTLDPATKKAVGRKMSDVCCEFPVVHPALACYPTRYVWAAKILIDKAADSDMGGIAKFDLTTPEGKDACIGQIDYPRGCLGGEAVFVPRNPKAGGAAEDDGWLLVYVYHPAEDTSKLHVYDAHTMAAEPVAVVGLPQRVPYGFHGTFVTEEQLRRQKTWEL